MRKRMRRKPRLALKRLIFFFIFFLLDIYLLQNSLFTSNNISHSNCYVRELSLWKPAFPPQMGFLLFRLIPTFTTNAVLYTFNFLNIVKKSVLQVTFSQQNSCSIEWIVFAEGSPSPLLLKWGTVSGVALGLHNLTLPLTWSTVDNLPARLVNFRSTVNKASHHLLNRLVGQFNNISHLKFTCRFS